jgi:3-mercaptopyruvate sulfurtransferase SseA
MTTYDRLKQNQTQYIDQSPRTKWMLRRLGHTKVQIVDLEQALKTKFQEG